jgi:methionyl-tRNA synthetase
LLDFYRRNPYFIYPSNYVDAVVKSISSGLQDLSISRPVERLNWGIRVPGDDTQTIYVWLDALVNYITYAGYPFPPGQEHAYIWPANVHVVGKDIVRSVTHVRYCSHVTADLGIDSTAFIGLRF